MQDEKTGLGALFARIAKVSAALGALPKEEKHEQGYFYHSADSIMAHLKTLMAENGLSVIPTVLETHPVDGIEGVQRWLIRYRFYICDTDGNVFEADWTGEAPLQGKRKDGSLYSDDKSLGKAHTYALKYWLLKLFMISTVDTDDLDKNVTDKDSPAQAANNGQAGKPSKPSQQTSNKTNQDKLIWETNLKRLVRPIYDNDPHLRNGLKSALDSGFLNYDMALNEAAAMLFNHRAEKALKLSVQDIVQILGKSPVDFKQEPSAFTNAWKALHDALAEMPH